MHKKVLLLSLYLHIHYALDWELDISINKDPTKVSVVNWLRSFGAS
jgi:hypothetical protein